MVSQGGNAEEKLRKLKAWLGAPPQYTTVRVNTRRMSAEAAKSAVQDHLDKNYVREGAAPLVMIHPVLKDLLVLVSRQVPARVVPLPTEVVVDRDCGEAVLRGAHVYIPGVLGAPKWLKAGEKVAVYADLDGSCLRGRTIPYSGNKAFVGNGTSVVSRADIFIGQMNRLAGTDRLMPATGCAGA